MSMKNSNDTFGNQTCDLPACSAVPQPSSFIQEVPKFQRGILKGEILNCV
jgi:hypothetical protein